MSVPGRSRANTTADPMAERLAFDTNAVIYLVEAYEPYASWLSPLFASVEAGQRQAVVSAISEAEAMVKPLKARDGGWIGKMAAFFGSYIEVVDVDRGIAREAARIRAGLDLSLPDAVIVATAIESGCDALVGNDSRCARRVKEIPYLYLEDVVTGKQRAP